MRAPRRICIVTSASVSQNPRAVKEADALSAAGYEVDVVASQNLDWVAAFDATTIEGRAWRMDAVRWDGLTSSTRARREWTRVRQQLFQQLSRLSLRRPIPESAYCRLYWEQLRRAARVDADLYIAHNPQALPVAARAAELTGALLAFDAEDDHLGELTPQRMGTLEYQLLELLERRYASRCAYITAASEGIADQMRKRYPGVPVATIHNTFPLAEANGTTGAPRDRQGSVPSLYWFSQTVGLDRGLQDVIVAARLVDSPMQLHLRGHVSDDVRSTLSAIAAKSPLLHLYFHPQVPPNDLLSRAAEHDIGLALEQPVNENREICVTNKLFLYLTVGLAVAGTSTRGQSRILAAIPDAGFLYPPGRTDVLAAGLRQWVIHPEALAAAKAAARRAARDRWNWEQESAALLALVSGAFTTTQRGLGFAANRGAVPV